MKKMNILLTFFVLAGFFATLAGRMETPAYRIAGSWVSDDGGYVETSLTVVMYSRHYNIDKVGDDVRRQHERMNGISDVLIIRFYDSIYALEESICEGERVYYKND